MTLLRFLKEKRFFSVFDFALSVVVSQLFCCIFFVDDLKSNRLLIRSSVIVIDYRLSTSIIDVLSKSIIDLLSKSISDYRLSD